MRVNFLCDYCSSPSSDRRSEYIKKRLHFCKRKCYTDYRREIMPPEEQNAWKGGITPEEARRNWAKRNNEKLKAMKKARQMREANAPGSHTELEWVAVKEAQHGQCAEVDCHRTLLTKDHIIPLIMGGSDDIENIQGLCRPHNSRKSRQVYIDALPDDK